MVSTLALYGVGRDEGLASPFVSQACWYIPTTLVGGALLVLRAPGRVRVPIPVSGHAEQRARACSVPRPKAAPKGGRPRRGPSFPTRAGWSASGSEIDKPRADAREHGMSFARAQRARGGCRDRRRPLRGGSERVRRPTRHSRPSSTTRSCSTADGARWSARYPLPGLHDTQRPHPYRFSKGCSSWRSGRPGRRTSFTPRFSTRCSQSSSTSSCGSLGGRPLVAALYACLSGLVFYPPSGNGSP